MYINTFDIFKVLLIGHFSKSPILFVDIYMVKRGISFNIYPVHRMHIMLAPRYELLKF